MVVLDEKAIGEGVQALLTMAISTTLGYISYIREASHHRRTTNHPSTVLVLDSLR
jgi:uncharacterized protein YktB (UPF0637 family)